jgi:hypothetical protein
MTLTIRLRTLLLGALLLGGFGAFATHYFDLLGRRSANLIIIAEAAVSNVTAEYFGRQVQSAPRLLPDSKYFLFPDLRRYGTPPSIAVAWQSADGNRHSVSRTLTRASDGRNCLYVLRIDQQGRAVETSTESISPFRWACDYQ